MNLNQEEREQRRVEMLSRAFHKIYQDEARRQAQTGEDRVRHPDDYDLLPEHTKEYDRVLARYVLALLDQERKRYLRIAMDMMAKRHAEWTEELRRIVDEPERRPDSLA